jgi:eukaryotic-like serine/threonine-protein kinase
MTPKPMSDFDKRAKDLFLAALEHRPADRPLFLSTACGDDAELRREVESLLAFHETEGGDSAGPSSDSAATGNVARISFEPGVVFAGRYRMIARIGRGGMGDVWHADDLVLDGPVALKIIYATSTDGRSRIVNEVRLARQITHSSVCRVFDIGESDGHLFLSMELVRGEDLARLLKRVGRLPSEKVVDIAHQLCGGIAAAHRQGVLHRDLKPANILIDDDGTVRITDFGIAIPRDDGRPHTLIGTPAYMAPEQLAPGAPLTERTDVFALGVVLYELIAGRHPFGGVEGSGPPAPPSTFVPDVHPQLERLVLQALSADPRERPVSAEAISAALPQKRRPKRDRRGRPWLVGAAVAAIVGGLAVAASLVPRGARALTEQDTIVIADFANDTGESVFDGTLKVALAVALEQSPFLKVFPDQRVQETLRLMQRSPDERITRAVAREIARREQLKALLAGSISRFGQNYVLGVEAINADSGDVMAREQVEVPGKEQVLTAVGQAAARLREKLGESLPSIRRFDVPLPRATTPSLEALHAYALALDEGRAVPREEAIPHLKRAIELDSNFALAQAHLSGVYANTGRSALAPEFSLRAFQLRDRVSERERFFISWRYYLDVAQAWDKALDLARSWTATYPREPFAFNSLGMASAAFGGHEQAVQAFQEAIRLDDRFVPPHGNLIGSLIASNRFDEAKAAVKEARARGIATTGVRRSAYVLAFLDGDSAGMTHEVDAARTTADALWTPLWEARTSLFEGRFRRAHELFRRGIDAALQSDLKEIAAQWSMEDAEAHAIAGDCPTARGEVESGLELGRDNYTMERAARTLAVCGVASEVSRLSDELARRFASAPLTMQVQLPVVAAALALHRRDAARALDVLSAVAPYDQAPAGELWPGYLRGLAFLQKRDGDAAGVQFQGVLDRRGVAPTSPLYALSHLGVARAATVSGDVGRARNAYDRFFALWSGADDGVAPLKEARLETARLGGTLAQSQ